MIARRFKGKHENWDIMKSSRETFNLKKEYMRRISLLQSEDIKKVVEKYFKGPWVVSLLVPSEKAESVKSMALPSILEKAGRLEPVDETQGKVPVFKTVLENGIRLIVKENRSNPIVTLQACFMEE